MSGITGFGNNVNGYNLNMNVATGSGVQSAEQSETDEAAVNNPSCGKNTVTYTPQKRVAPNSAPCAFASASAAGEGSGSSGSSGATTQKDAAPDNKTPSVEKVEVWKLSTYTDGFGNQYDIEECTYTDDNGNIKIKYRWSGDVYESLDDLAKDMMENIRLYYEKNSSQESAVDQKQWGYMFTGDGITWGKGFNGNCYTENSFSLKLGAVNVNGEGGFGIKASINFHM